MIKRKNTKLAFPLVLLAIVLFVVSLLVISSPQLAEKTSGTVLNNGDISSSQAQEENALTVHFIDVGQGDCILAVCEGKTMLIDAGDNGTEQTVINYIHNLGISYLDYIVVTHQHSDHIGGMPEILREFKAGTIIMPRLSKELTPTSSTYSAFLKELQSSSVKKLYAKVGAIYNLGEAVLTVIAPINSDAEDLNNMSVVIRLDYVETSFLLAGDASAEEESDILDSGADIDCDILKVGHHGSSKSSTKDFLAAVTPEVAVIMCGKDNSYNHPNQKTLERLSAYTSRIYRTDICSDIVFTCGKSGYTVDY